MFLELALAFSRLSLLLALEGSIVIAGFLDQVSEETGVGFGSTARRPAIIVCD